MFFPVDTYDIYSYSAEARCFAIGAGTVNAFPGFNLNTEFSSNDANFGSAPEDHSAQFRATNMIRHEFWNKLLENLDLLPDIIE